MNANPALGGRPTGIRRYVPILGWLPLYDLLAPIVEGHTFPTMDDAVGHVEADV
jgi:hypothetical protein